MHLLLWKVHSEACADSDQIAASQALPAIEWSLDVCEMEQANSSPGSPIEQEAATMQLNGQELHLQQPVAGIREAAQGCGCPQDTGAERTDRAICFHFRQQGAQCHAQSGAAGCAAE
jgi:hypothetical protein